MTILAGRATPPPDPPPTELRLAAHERHAATVKALHAEGGHITRAEIKAAVDALAADLAAIERSTA